MTARQQRALACFEQAHERGVALSAHARELGLGVREVYDAVAALRRKGVLAPGAKRAPRAAPDVAKGFVRVRVQADAAAPATPICCRLRVGAMLIECAVWPPAAWVASLAAP